jgi:hypothetical protein
LAARERTRAQRLVLHNVAMVKESAKSKKDSSVLRRDLGFDKDEDEDVQLDVWAEVRSWWWEHATHFFIDGKTISYS